MSSSPTDDIAQALQAFRVGYAPSGWDELAKHLRAQGISPAVAERAGLLLSRSSGEGYYDRFRHRLMFPVVDLHGRVVAFSGRVLPDPSTGEVDKTMGKYINSPETPVYRKGETVFGLFQARGALRESQTAVVVEGNFDVVSLHARGLRNVVAPLGTAFTTEQATLLKRFSPQVVLLFDGDAAGRKATRAAREPCRQAGLQARAALLPGGVDPDDFVRSEGPERLRALVGAARGLLEHLIAAAMDEGFTTASGEERLTRVREVAELLRSEDDPVVRAMARSYADDIASRLARVDSRLGMVDQETFSELSRVVERALRAPLTQSVQADSPQGVSRREERPRLGQAPDRISEEMLGCLLDFPHILMDSSLNGPLSYLDGEATLAVLAIQQGMVPAVPLEGSASDELVLDADKVLAAMPEAFQGFARQRLANPVHVEIDAAMNTLLENAEKLQRRSLKHELRIDAKSIEQAEAKGAEDEALMLLGAAQRRARARRGLA